MANRWPPRGSGAEVGWAGSGDSGKQGAGGQHSGGEDSSLGTLANQRKVTKHGRYWVYAGRRGNEDRIEAYLDQGWIGGTSSGRRTSSSTPRRFDTKAPNLSLHVTAEPSAWGGARDVAPAHRDQGHRRERRHR